MAQVRFQIIPPIDRPGDPVTLAMEHGGGEPLELAWEPPFHVGEIEVPEGTSLRYQVRRGSRACEVDAFGSPMATRSHDTWLNNTIVDVVADWEDRFTGRLERVTVPSEILQADREVLVWLPPGYFENEATQFPLIIGFDGSRLFNPVTSPSGVDWALDETVGLLSRRGVMPECIVAGVVESAGEDASGHSLRDVELSEERGGERFSSFAALELTPFLEGHYRTIPKSASRTVVGAGLGGLRAFWTAMGYPEVFGRAACLSTSFEDISQSLPATSRSLLAVEEGMFPPGAGRFYFDHGDTGLDECYEIYHTILSGLLREKGWVAGRDFEIRRVPESGHDDLSWRARIGDALRWLAGQTSR
jgi:enterochelin esterase-like enzyme